MQRTLAIIKPDGVERDLVNTLTRLIEAQGIKIILKKMIRLTLPQTERFYAVHKELSYFKELTAHNSSGFIVVMVLEAENVIVRWRALMGHFDPGRAAEGTIRRMYAENMIKNVVHGSDSRESAKPEINFFFNKSELPE